MSKKKERNENARFSILNVNNDKDSAEEDAESADANVGDAEKVVLGARPRRRTHYKPLMTVKRVHQIFCNFLAINNIITCIILLSLVQFLAVTEL